MKTIKFNRKLGAFPTLMNIFCGKPVFGEIFLERIPFDDIPTEADESSQWLLDSFYEKVSSVIVVSKIFMTLKFNS